MQGDQLGSYKHGPCFRCPGLGDKLVPPWLEPASTSHPVQDHSEGQETACQNLHFQPPVKDGPANGRLTPVSPNNQLELSRAGLFQAGQGSFHAPRPLPRHATLLLGPSLVAIETVHLTSSAEPLSGQTEGEEEFKGLCSKGCMAEQSISRAAQDCKRTAPARSHHRLWRPEII